MEAVQSDSKGPPARSTLALRGGVPVRTKEFASKALMGQQELEAVCSVIRSGQLSTFVGSPTPSTRDELRQTSATLATQTVIGGSFVGGPWVRRFEAQWAGLLGSDYCVSLNSATSGLSVALLALGLEPGSEVITTPFSFTATVGAILLANCVPVFCDIDPETFCLSPEALERCITERTRCVMPVHWCGNAGDFDQLLAICRARRLRIVEDAAQAPATWYQSRALGTFGDLGVFSLNQPKHITTGEGGLIVTADADLAARCRMIRNHGEAIIDDDDALDDMINGVGRNYRLTELQAALGCAQVDRLPGLNTVRAQNYAYLRDRLSQFGDVLVPQRITHLDSFFAYTAAFRWNSSPLGVSRDTVAQALRAEGVPVFTGYRRLLCDHPMCTKKIAYGRTHHPWHPGYYTGEIDYRHADVTNARRLLTEQFLGFLQTGWPNTSSDMDDIVTAFDKIVRSADELRSH